MKLHILLASAFLALAACGGTGVTNLGGGDDDGEGGGGLGGGGGDGGGETAGDTCAGAYVCSDDVLAVSYDGDTDTLIITGTPFDETPLAATYVRAAVDINGIPTYVNDENPFNDYIAYHVQSPGGEISVGATNIDSYQTFGYSGTFIQVADGASLPSTGLIEFTGPVAGLVAYTGSGALDVSTGTAFMQVDFTDNRIRGGIFSRTHTGTETWQSVLNLNDTTIESGSFAGTVSSYDGPDEVETGTYNGSFAGGAGEYVGVTYDAINGDYAEGITSRDRGVFVATSCGGVCP